MISLSSLLAQTAADVFEEKKEKTEKKEFTFIGYYFVRSELNNIAPTNEFLKGQVVGRIFGGNTTRTSKKTSRFTEQRFMPLIAYTPRLFDGWATMRMSFEFDWTWGDANYGAGGNFGGAFGADFVNMQTQNLFIEFRPQKNVFINVGLTRLFDNVRVPYRTFTSTLVHTGYRLAFWGSDAAGITGHYFWPDKRLKLGFWQLYENNVEQDDDITLYEVDFEYDLDIVNSIGVSLWYLKDHANGEGGVSILGQGHKLDFAHVPVIAFCDKKGSFMIGRDGPQFAHAWLGGIVKPGAIPGVCVTPGSVHEQMRIFYFEPEGTKNFERC